MSAEELRALIEALDLNPRYNLRRTEDRLDRLRTFLSSTDLDSVGMPATPPRQPSPTRQQLFMMAQAERSIPASRFTGYVPEGHPKRDQLMSFDVNRWLCEAETRCTVKGIVDDILKIKEAKLTVASDVGDACIVLNTGRMNEIKKYDEFKAKCLKFWRPASERDRYHALSDFLSVDFDKSMGVLAGNLERARSRILQDLKGDTSFNKGTAADWTSASRGNEILVSLDEVINYFSWGVLFKAVPPSFREALRKVEVKYTDDYMDILSAVQSEMLKTEKTVSIEVSAVADRSVRSKEYTNSAVRKSSSPKSQGSVKCYRCEKIGHIKSECRVKLTCTFCKKEGHISSRCFAAKKQNKKAQGASGNAASNSNVVDASHSEDS